MAVIQRTLFYLLILLMATACNGGQSASNIEPEPFKLSPSLQFGYVERGGDCLERTEIVAKIIEHKVGSSVGLSAYQNADDLFAALAQQNSPIDLTVCFLDPIDRPYLNQYHSYMSQIGGVIHRTETDKVLMMARPGLHSSLKKHNPCIYQFLQKLNFEERRLASQSAEVWIDENIAIVQSWTQCAESIIE